MTVSIDYSSKKPEWVPDSAVRAAKQACRLDPDTPDSDLPVSFVELLATAVELLESLQWRVIQPKTVNASLSPEILPGCDSRLWLPYGRLVVNSLELTIIDKDGDTVIVSSDELLVHGAGTDFCWLQPKGPTWSGWNQLLNSTLYSLSEDHPEPISISWQAGYSSWSDLPGSSRNALTLLVKSLYYDPDTSLDHIPDSVMTWARMDKLEAREGHRLLI